MVDNRKFNKILTVILVLILIAIIVSIGFIGYDFLQKYYINKGADDAIDEQGNETIAEVNHDKTQAGQTTKKSNSSNAIALKYKGFDVAGKIEIPKINVKYPILTVATLSSMKVSVGIVYGPGLNKPGNTVIMGHNYRNGSLFSKNKKLNNGDEIYITDLTGTRLKYVIYNKYETSSTDFDYATRDTAGAKEISLASCTDDSSSRLIIWARAVE